MRNLIDWIGVRAMTRRGSPPEVDMEHAVVIEKLKKDHVERAAKVIEVHVQVTEHYCLTCYNREKGQRIVNR